MRNANGKTLGIANTWVARTAAGVVACVVASCGPTAEGLPEGAVARVGDRVLDPTDVAEVQAQLGRYAQTRFRGEEGKQALVRALIETELLNQEAIDAGFADDPRVEWAVLEEMATIQLSSEMERRVPYAQVAANTEALEAYYEAHAKDFTAPEQRKVGGVLVDDFAEGAALIAKVKAGEESLAGVGEIIFTGPFPRDDAKYPASHAVIFDPELKKGDLMPHPVMFASQIFVGYVHEIVPAKRTPLEDPVVRETVTKAVRAQLVAKAQEEYLAELAEKYPDVGK